MTIQKINKTYQEVPMDKLRIGKHQVRTRNTDAGIDELAQSISKIGLLEPIVVVDSQDEEGHFEVITGQRRFLACQTLEWENIPAMVLDETPDEYHALTISLTENMMRRNISEKEYIDACTQLHRKYGDPRIVAEETGLPLRDVKKYIRFPGLTEGLKRAVEEGHVDLNHALIANEHCEDADGEKDEDIALAMAQRMQDKGLGPTNSRKYAKLVQGKLVKEGKVSEADLDQTTTMQVSEKRLSISLEPKVDNALGDYSTQLGARKTDAASLLVTSGLAEKGYLADEE